MQRYQKQSRSTATNGTRSRSNAKTLFWCACRETRPNDLRSTNCKNTTGVRWWIKERWMPQLSSILTQVTMQSIRLIKREARSQERRLSWWVQNRDRVKFETYMGYRVRALSTEGYREQAAPSLQQDSIIILILKRQSLSNYDESLRRLSLNRKNFRKKGKSNMMRQQKHIVHERFIWNYLRRI